MLYVIHKRTRQPDFYLGSYDGLTWSLIPFGLRQRFQRYYEDENEAQMLAVELTFRNPVGFTVSKVE